MKKIFLYTSIIFISSLVPVACIDDETTGLQTDGSPISIVAEDTVLYRDFGLSLVIEPEVTQLLADLPLQYEWRWTALDEGEGKDSLRLISTEKVLNYKFQRAGVFQLRLRVENQYGSSFKYFRVYIQAPFEQGILILSNDEQDRSRISFLRLKEEEELLEKENTDFNLDAFRQSNPELLLRGARDVIFTRTGHFLLSNYVLAVSSEPDQKVYFLNSRYFLLENIADIKKFYPEAYPTVLSGNAANEFHNILFATNNQAGQPGDYGMIDINSILAYPGETSGKYDKVITGEEYLKKFGLRYNVCCLIDNTNSKVTGIINSREKYTTEDEFAGKQVINAVFRDVQGRIILVAVDKNNPLDVSIYRTDKSEEWNWDDQKITYESVAYNYIAGEKLTLTSDCRMVANDKYQYVYYYNGNKIYRWIHMTQEPKLPDKAELTLENPHDEITYMEVSPNQEHLWVCVYNPQADTELKGKLLVINPETMVIEKTFKGISDRALKIMWKPVTFTTRE